MLLWVHLFLQLEKAVKKKSYNLFILTFMEIDREI